MQTSLRFLAGIATLALFATSPVAAKTASDYYEEVSRFNKVLSEINRRYVESVDPAELTEAAMTGIRTVLDPHTMVLIPKNYDDLKVQTEGEFGGIGITIATRDNVLTVISPLQGTPAFQLGLQAGDRIVKINGKSTHKLSLEDAVDKLRGPIGTDVTISIAREGAADLMDFTITRAKIVVHAVPYSGMIDKEIGYIKLAQFSQKTGPEVEAAIKQLKAKGMKKLVFDLRFNPGGLLNQAVEIAELFLKKGNVIVSTRGRTQQTESSASRNGLLGADVPMVVLINEGSASASEIVAGALQDWDRAVILGKTSFGKGSVQSIFPLDHQGNALKLTTAFYYLPMGRCVNRPENGIKGLSLQEDEMAEDSEEEVAEDSLDAKVDTTVKDSQVYYTNAGRKMYGAGGITPDIDVLPRAMPWIVQVQERMNLYFKFAVKIRSTLKKADIRDGWMLSDSLYEDFRAFCAKDTNFTKAKTGAQASADVIQDVLLREQKYLGDSSASIADSNVRKAYEALQVALRGHRDAQFDASKSYIREAIVREVISAFHGEESRIAYSLKADNQVLEAIKVLRDPELYRKTLTAPVAVKEEKIKDKN